jgi:hypothetical protein
LMFHLFHPTAHQHCPGLKNSASCS